MRAAASPLSMYIGPQDVLLTLDVEFEREAAAADIVAAVARIEHEIRVRFPNITRIYIEARALTRAPS